MWDRKELKAKGKAAYRANRLMCIIAALLLALVSGAAAGGASAGQSLNAVDNHNDSVIEDYDYDYDYDYDDMYDDDFDVDGEYEDIDDIDDIEDVPELSGDSSLPPIFGIALLIVFLVILAIGLAISAFLFNPLKVGLQKFFLDNANDPKTGLNKNNIGVAFNNGNYMKVVGSMFSTDIFTILWSMLFIIPGIYKAYCWRMVPYIVSENPTISGKEARAISTKMMDGNKWAAFVLDLSFLGWLLLGVLTLNILNLVFTNPYIYATDAELYLTLSGRPTSFDGQTEPVVQFGADDPEVYADPVVEVDPVVQVDHAAPTEPVEQIVKDDPAQKEPEEVIIEFDQEGTNE